MSRRGRTLTDDERAQIQELAVRFSNKQISDITGVSRQSITRLLNGTKRRPQVYYKSPERSKMHRCSGCGGMIYTRSCLKCKMQNAKGMP